MQPNLAVIWIHYETPALLRESIAAVTADLPCTHRNSELVVVDNGGLDTAPAGTHVIRPFKNIGYAAGVNLGLTQTRSPNVLVMNPDVLVRPGCIAALLGALQRWPIVAPVLYLDREHRFHMPPTEQYDFLSVCIAELGRHQPLWTGYARRRWRRHAYRHWQPRSDALRTYDLSGAMLGFTRRAYQTVGPWDEAYRLYFEETDWLQRAKKNGLKAALIPASAGVHLYAASSRKNPYAERWFADSRHRFEHTHFQSWQNALLVAIRRSGQRTFAPAPAPRTGTKPAWVELSNHRCGFPAAAARVSDMDNFAIGISPVMRRQLPAGSYWMRWVDARGNEVGVSRCQI